MSVIGGGTIFKKCQKWRVSADQNWRDSAGHRVCTTGGCLRVMCPLKNLSFFKNVVLNEAIWCSIFHYVKHLTACLLGDCLLLKNRMFKKVEGPCPQSEKWTLASAPPPTPGSATYDECQFLNFYSVSVCKWLLTEAMQSLESSSHAPCYIMLPYSYHNNGNGGTKTLRQRAANRLELLYFEHIKLLKSQ